MMAYAAASAMSALMCGFLIRYTGRIVLISFGKFHGYNISSHRIIMRARVQSLTRQYVRTYVQVSYIGYINISYYA